MLLIGSIALLLVVGVATVRESYQGWKVDREIQALQAQADELEGRNAKLRDLARALQDPERMEVEARIRLGLQEPGEHVVVLSGLDVTSTWRSAVKLDVVQEKPEIERSNPERWFNYFFQPERLNS